jgi:4-hydroxy-3-polyprenylbenzoate decarboxylase
MAFDSFLDFVNALDQAGELKRLFQPVATELEITGIADREMKPPGGSKPGFVATKQLPGAGINRAWPPLIKMDAALRKKIGVFGKE